MTDKPVVVTDTTTTKTDVMMAGTRWVQVLSLSARDWIRLSIPIVVLRETARHWEEQARKALTRVQQGPRSLADLGVGSFELPTSVAGFAVNPDEYCRAQTERLNGLGAEILPLPNVTVPEILDRDLARRKPFAPSGKGFRDALIWHSLKELLAKLDPGTLVYLVTNNESDFCDGGAIHPELLLETEEFDVDLRHAPTLEALLETDAIAGLIRELSTSPAERDISDVPEEAPLPSLAELIRRAVEDAAEDLHGKDIASGLEREAGLDFSDVEVPREIENATIRFVSADPGSFDWDAYETYEEDTLLVRATIDADVDIEGFVFKADYYGIEDDVELLEFDWNKHYAYVSISVPVRLVFQLRVEAASMDVESIDFEVAESLISDAN